MGKDLKNTQTVGWESPIAVHPGLLLQDLLEEFSMSQDDLAKRLELTPKTVNEILKGKASITNVTALKLSKVFPVSEDYWNNLQKIYYADLARLGEAEKIKNEIEQHLENYKETYAVLTELNLIEKYRWVKSNFELIVQSLHKYFGANSLLYVEQELIIGTAFRTYSKKSVNPYTIAAWLRAGERKAQNVKVPLFDLKKLKAILPTIKSLSTKRSEEYLPKLENLLGECGIVLVYMPYFRNSHTQGAVRWVSKDKVLLMLNTSKRSEDKFWFNLFHELGHIICHGKFNKEDGTKMYLDLENSPNNQIETEADQFAQETLIPNYKGLYKDFCACRDYKKGILDISKKLGISPAIFAGRIAHEYAERGSNVYGILSEFWSKNQINYSNI